MILGAHFLLLTFFENFTFNPIYLLKWRPIFDNFYSTERKTKKLFKGLVVGLVECATVWIKSKVTLECVYYADKYILP